VFKGYFTILMILGHLLAFIRISAGHEVAAVLLAHNHLVIFPGLLFAFGFSCYHAYFSRQFSAVRRRMLITTGKCLVAYYLCGCVYYVVMDSPHLSWGGLLQIATFSRLPVFAEFLLAYLLFIGIGLLAFPVVVWLLEQRPVFLLACLLSLLMTAFPYWLIHSPRLGIIVGMDTIATFPIAQYAIYFLLGLYFARYRINWHPTVTVVAMLATSVTLADYILTREIPTRFPPSFEWLLAPALLIYIYYLLSRKTAANPWLLRILQAFGRNVLFYLVMSNLAIFIFHLLYPQAQQTLWQAVGLMLALFSGITVLLFIARPLAVQQRT